MCMRKPLLPVIARHSDLRVMRGKKYLALSHKLKSYEKAWQDIWECILKNVGDGIVNIEVVSEGPDVFDDCEECDQIMEAMLQDMITPPPPDFDPMKFDLTPLFTVNLTKLKYAVGLLTSPPRPYCGEPGCSQDKPVPKGKYVATLSLYFKDAEFDVDFYSE